MTYIMDMLNIGGGFRENRWWIDGEFVKYVSKLIMYIKKCDKHKSGL